MLPLARWCLDELVKILERRQRTDHQVVLPVLFYDTEEPSDVQKQTGSYAKALDEHEERFQEEMEKVNKGRGALAETGNLYGWGLIKQCGKWVYHLPCQRSTCTYQQKQFFLLLSI
jgi:hypothetical protein